jgi:CHAT domain-containing protein/tetratricopeptide (TPR) repeat protein
MIGRISFHLRTMIELSITGSASAYSATRFAHGSRHRSLAFAKVRIARAGVLICLVCVQFGQTALSKPGFWPPQTSNTFEGLKLIQEGKRLAEIGTRATLMEAVDKYKAAYDCFRKDNFRRGMGITLFAAGGSYLSLGQKRRALDAFLEAAPYIKEMGDSALQVTIFAVIGLVYTKLSEWKPAIEYLEQALALLQKEKNPELLASVLGGLGGTYIKLGKKQKGLEYLERALRLFQETHDRNLETQLLSAMGAGFSSLGQQQKGLELAQRALQLARGEKDRANEARALMSLGEIHNALGDRQGALRDYNEALRVGQEAIDRAWKPTVLSSMAAIYLDFGEIDQSTALYEAAIKASQTEGEPEDAALGLNGLAMIAERRAEPLKALSYYQRALALARAIKDQIREAGALGNIAGVYDSFNQHEQALKALREAVAIYRNDEDPNGESTALANMGSLYDRMGRHREAFDWLNRALALQRANKNREGQAHTLFGLGDAYRNDGDPAKALEAYTESLALMIAVEDRVGETQVCSRLALVYHMQGNHQKASEYYLRALPLTRAAGNRREEAVLLGSLGLLHEDMGDLKAAEALFEQSLELIEHIRTAARLEEFKTEIASGTAELYSRAILLKIKSGKAAEAFELSERARARTLLDQLNGTRISMRKSADRELIEQEQALRFEMASLEKKLQEEMSRGGAPEACAPLEERLKQGRQAYAEIVVRLKVSNPEYAELQGYSPILLGEIQQLLGPETTLLSYYVTASKTLIFIVTRDSLNVVEVPVGEKELRNAVDWFRSFASLRDPEPASLKQLDGWLITPIRQYLKTPMICVIPHSILHQLPFAAIHNGKGYFGEQHTIYYLPAASLLPSIARRNRPASKPMLAIAQAKAEGWPALHYVDQEAETVARLYNGKALLTGQALKAEFLRLAGNYDILHIASHAELNTRSPLFSRFLLTPDQNGNQGLEVREIYDLNLSHTSLVVLSACETQLGAQSRGDDIVGLNRAFLYAGTSSVIASLWTVDDQATGLLMRSFYTHLKRGMGKAQALRVAQSETRRQYPNPYYWAAFILTGNAGLTDSAHSGGLRRGTAQHRK